MIEFIDEDGVVLTQAEFRRGVGRGRVRERVTGFEASIVDESKLPDTDLNVLVKRWQRGEVVPQFAPMQFGNVADVGDYQEMQERLLVVTNAFATLPAHMRAFFDNDPVKFADQLVDPARREALVELGLLKGEEAEPPVEAAKPTPPAGPAAGPGPGDGGDATDRKS